MTTHSDLVEAGARQLLRAEEATSYEDAVAAALTGIGYALLADQVDDEPELCAHDECDLPQGHPRLHYNTASGRNFR